MDRPRYVYAIQHNISKCIYIGSSQDVETRYHNHMYQLRAGKHKIEDMQADFDKYGEDYSLFILEEFTSCRDRSLEYEWMMKYQSHIRGKGYNYKDRVAANWRNRVPLKDGKPQMEVEARG